MEKVIIMVVTDLKRGTTFHTTANSSSGEIVADEPCHNAHNIFLSSSTNVLQLNNDVKISIRYYSMSLKSNCIMVQGTLIHWQCATLPECYHFSC